MKEINRRWFSVKAGATEAEIAIFDEIGIWGVTVADFKRELDAIKSVPAIKLLLNSPGGSVFDGMAIYNLLAPMKDRIDVHVLGLAASIASVIALSGKSLKMDTGSYFMIHDPWAIAMGSGKDLRKTADLLDQIGGTMADIYTGRSGLTREEVLALMAEETWMTAEEAADAGFADEVVEGQAIAALVCDLSKFNYQHAPAAMLERIERKPNPPSTPRDLECALRDAGYSRTIAAGIVKKGFSAVREGVPDETDAGSASTTAVAAAASIESVAIMAPKGRRKDTLECSVVLAEIQQSKKGVTR